MAKAKIVALTGEVGDFLSDLSTKMAVDCELISRTVNPLFCSQIVMTPYGEVIFAHKNADLFAVELVDAVVNALLDEELRPVDREKLEKIRELIEGIRKELPFKEEHSNTDSDRQSD